MKAEVTLRKEIMLASRARFPLVQTALRGNKEDGNSARMEAEFAGFPLGWKQMLRDSGGMEEIMQDSHGNEDEFYCI